MQFNLLAMMQVVMLYMVNEIVGKNCGFGTNPFDLSGRQGWLAREVWLVGELASPLNMRKHTRKGKMKRLN